MNEAEIKKIAREMYDQADFAAWRTDREKWDSILEGADKIDKPEFYSDTGISDYHSFAARHALNVVVQELGRANPRLSTFSRSVDPERTKGAQNFESFFNQQWSVWNEGMNAPYPLTCSDQGCRGLGTYKLSLRSAVKDGKNIVWADRPSGNGKELDAYKLRQPTPFVLERIDPLTLAWFEDADGMAVCVEQSKRPLNPVLEMYGLALRNDRFEALGEGRRIEGADPPKSVTFVEVCTRDTIYHLVEQAKSRGNESKHLIVGSYPNPFGAVRYSFAPAFIEGSSEVSKRFRPLIEGALKLTPLKSMFGTARKHAAVLAAYKTFDIVQDKDGLPYLDQQGNPMSITIAPYEPDRFVLPPGCHREPREATNVDLDKMQAFVEDELRQVMPPDVLSGGTEGERQPAWSLAVSAKRAEYRIDPGIRGQQGAIKEIARMVGWAIKNWLKEPVLIWTMVTDDMGKTKPEQVKVSPDDIEEDFLLDVDMRYQSLDYSMAQLELLRRGWQEGHVSERQLMEEGYQQDNPEMTWRQVDADRLRTAMRNWRVFKAMKIAIGDERQAQGQPPLSPEEEAAMEQAAVGGERAEERRAASPVRATGLESGTMPSRQRIT